MKELKDINELKDKTLKLFKKSLLLVEQQLEQENRISIHMVESSSILISVYNNLVKLETNNKKKKNK